MTTQSSGVLFVLDSFPKHMDNGRWLFQLGMEKAGYVSAGYGLTPPGFNTVDVPAVLRKLNPSVVVFWPRYEWDSEEWGGGPEVRPEHRFQDWECLLDRSDILRVCVLHDAASALDKQYRWHQEFQPHVYLTWYHNQSVLHHNPHIKPEQIVRTYHVIDADRLPPVLDRSGTCIISGAENQEVYPLRTSAIHAALNGELGPGVDVLGHPGYHQSGTKSYEYAEKLSKYRVALCTASKYGFALRKIIEASAIGCVVVTNLPPYDCLSGIDDNLVRVPEDISMNDLMHVIHECAVTWNYSAQRKRAEIARKFYDYRMVCGLVAREFSERNRGLAKP